MSRLPRLALVALLLVPSLARADGEDPKVAAEALFGDGRALFKQGDYAGACAKFVESNRLDPAVGTEFNLADCEEHLGHLATSWAHWRHVVDVLASRPDDVRLPMAREHVAILELRLPRLVITLAPGAPAQTTVKLDELAISRSALDSGLAADPGAHTITASAPGRREGRLELTLAEAEARTVSIAPGDPLPLAPSAAESAPTGEPDRARRRLALVVGGAGILGLGIGSALGVVASSQWSSAQRLCPSPTQCDPTAETKVGEARSAGNASTGAFIAGGALVAAGLVLWFTAPRGRALGVAPAFGAGVAGASLVGRFE